MTALDRRLAITVDVTDADAGRGSCWQCAELIGNYHADDCAQLAAERVRRARAPELPTITSVIERGAIPSE